MKLDTKALTEILSNTDDSQVAITAKGTCLNAEQYERVKDKSTLILKAEKPAKKKGPSKTTTND